MKTALCAFFSSISFAKLSAVAEIFDGASSQGGSWWIMSRMISLSLLPSKG